MSITVQIKSRSGRDLGSYEVAPSTTVTEFKKDFAKKNPKYYPSRQMFSFEQDGATVRLTEPDKHVIGDYKVKQGEVLTFKDLGAQVGWRTVFLVEYFGPILIHSLFYFFPSIFYGSSVKQRNPVATIGFACVVFHYVKRELETIFIHRFSAETMPFFNIFKNSAHYWVLSGLFIAYPLYHPKYTNSLPMTLVYAAVGVFLLGELGNFLSHVTLMNLRPAGTRTRGIPRGGLFELVSCANYTYELLAWLAFSYFSQCITAYLFFLVSAGQIWLWAIKKHKRYIAEFPDYPRGRKALVPFLA